MPCILNRDARIKLLEEDIEWLRSIRTASSHLEADHIEIILTWLLAAERNGNTTVDSSGRLVVRLDPER